MKYQKGFGVIEVLIIVAVLALLGVGGWYIWQNNSNKTQPAPIVDESSNNTSNNTNPALVNNAKNTQIKTDMAALATAVLSYVNDNQGSYPASEEDLVRVKTDYINGQSFKSPLTGEAYVLTRSSNQAKGVINLLRGVCNEEENGTEPASSPRQYALLTLLTDDSPYCLEL